METPETGLSVHWPPPLPDDRRAGAERAGLHLHPVYAKDHVPGAGRGGSRRGCADAGALGADLLRADRRQHRVYRHPGPGDGLRQSGDHLRHPPGSVPSFAGAALQLLRQPPGRQNSGAGHQLCELRVGYSFQRHHQQHSGDHQRGRHHRVHVLDGRDAGHGGGQRPAGVHRHRVHPEAPAAQGMAAAEQQELQLQRLSGRKYRRSEGVSALRPSGGQLLHHEAAGAGLPGRVDEGHVRFQRRVAVLGEPDADRVLPAVYRGRLLAGRQDGLLRRDPCHGFLCEPLLAAHHQSGEHLQLFCE